MTATTGMSQSAISRILARVRAKAASDGGVQALARPQFIDKVRDIVGLYLNPPMRQSCCAWMRSPQIQATDLDNLANYCQRINDSVTSSELLSRRR